MRQHLLTASYSAHGLPVHSCCTCMPTAQISEIQISEPRASSPPLYFPFSTPAPQAAAPYLTMPFPIDWEHSNGTHLHCEGDGDAGPQAPQLLHVLWVLP